MPYKFNPFTGTLDFYEKQLTKSEVIHSILLDRALDETLSILFDEDSILINDDEALT